MKLFVKIVVGVSILSLSGCGPAEEVTAPEVDAPAEVLDAVEADPVHYTVEFENDAVQIIRIRYAAGERSVMHSHPANCVVWVTDATFSMTPASGDAATDTGAAGSVLCGDGETHLPENVGDADADVVMIAFKGRSTFDSGSTGAEVAGFDGAPNAVEADAAHYSVEAENDVLRVVRITYPPGEESVMHSHSASCTVGLSVFMANETLPSGEEISGEPGTVGTVDCGDATVHQPRNVGDTNAELIMFELKGRDSFE